MDQTEIDVDPESLQRAIDLMSERLAQGALREAIKERAELRTWFEREMRTSRPERE